MREITEVKFRGKRTDNGEWVEGDLTLYSKAVSYITVDLIENQVYEVHTDTVGQFTHLKDKNGREVYEGDLYQYTSTSEVGIGGKIIKTSEITRIKPIVFEEGAFYHGHDLLADVIEYDDTFTYVGNIYDNPELLGDSK